MSATTMPAHPPSATSSSRRRRLNHRRQRKEHPTDEVSASSPASRQSSNPSSSCLLLGQFLSAMMLGIGMGLCMLSYSTTNTTSPTTESSIMRDSVHLGIPIFTSIAVPSLDATPKSGHPVVAYVISVTDCRGSNKNSHHDLVDAASVLKHSIHLSSVQNPSSQSQYDYQMYALIHEEGRHNDEACASLAPALEQIGYSVQWKPTPFDMDKDVLDEHAFFKEKVHKQGCCGEREFLKLFTLQLLEHPIAVHLDLDTLLFRPLDHLYHAMLDPSNLAARDLVRAHRQSYNGPDTIDKRPLPDTIEAYFTRDYNMAVPGIAPTRVLMQGGFWIVRPNRTTFHEIVALIIMKQAHRFDPKCGWGGCSLGNARLYGGAGFQGLISYYYTFVQSRDPTLLKDSSSSSSSISILPPSNSSNDNFVELNRCLYNSMADNPRKACAKGEVNACNDCNDVPLKEVYGAHFTLCQKPWNYCKKPYKEGGGRPLCEPFHRKWQSIRSDFETAQLQQLVASKQGNSSTTSHLLSFTERCITSGKQ